MTVAAETAFLEALIAQAKALGLEMLTLDHLEGNVRAHRLYEKLGFVTVAEVPKAFRLPDGSYQKSILMMKEL